MTVTTDPPGAVLAAAGRFTAATVGLTAGGRECDGYGSGLFRRGYGSGNFRRSGQVTQFAWFQQTE